MVSQKLFLRIIVVTMVIYGCCVTQTRAHFQVGRRGEIYKKFLAIQSHKDVRKIPLNRHHIQDLSYRGPQNKEDFDMSTNY